jgi:very-short-patch-repair endonuclease
VGGAQRQSGFNESPERFARKLAGRQHGLLTAAQARSLGLDASAVSRRVGGGLWERILPGVYRIAGAPATGRQAALAGVLWAGEGAVVSHRAAGALWSIAGAETTRVEVTVPYARARRHAAVRVHRTGAMPTLDQSEVHGIPVTSPARTIIDLGSVLRGEDLEAAVEDVFRRRLCRPAFLEWRLRELGGKGRAGAGELAAMLGRRGDDVAALEYRLEVKMWRLLAGSGLALPERQYTVRADGTWYRLDFAWPDGKIAVEGDGYDSHGGRLAFVRDHRRLAALGAAGWRVLPFTWEQVTREPQRVVAQVRQALADVSLKPESRTATVRFQ